MSGEAEMQAQVNNAIDVLESCEARLKAIRGRIVPKHLSVGGEYINQGIDKTLYQLRVAISSLYSLK